jgi:hypothetical protein
MPTLVVGMFRRNLAIRMPTTSVGMPPIKLRMVRDAALEFAGKASPTKELLRRQTGQFFGKLIERVEIVSMSF